MSAVPYSYGHWRTHNCSGTGVSSGQMSWADMQPTQGSYAGTGSDQAAMVLNWTGFDAQLDEAAAIGVSVMWMVWRCPSWAVSTADRAYTDAFGGVGAIGVPTNMQFVRDFVTAALTRAIARNRRIRFVELWNEPTFAGPPPAQSSFTGTPAQMASMCWAGYSAAKAVDPNVVVIAPSQYNATQLQQFLSAQDPISGKYGYQCCDALAIHPYRQGPNKAVQSGSDALYWAAGGGLGIREANRILATLGQPPKPVYATEWGLSVNAGDNEVTVFNALPSATKKLYVQRMILMAALGGMAGFTIFSNGTLAGDYTNDTTGVIAAVTDVHTKIAGKTIVAGGYMPDGSVTVTLSTGQTYVW